MNYRSREEQALALVTEFNSRGVRAWAGRADVRDSAQVQALFEKIEASGGVDSIVHAATPPLPDRPFRKTAWEVFEDHWQTTIHGAYSLVQNALISKAPASLRSVVFILSGVTLGMPPAGKSPYTTSKFALLGLAKSLAIELADKGIRVNCVSPGFTPTELTAQVDDRIRDLIARSVPARRLCTADDVAEAVYFLVSSGSSYITGINLPITGGAGAQ